MEKFMLCRPSGAWSYSGMIRWLSPPANLWQSLRDSFAAPFYDGQSLRDSFAVPFFTHTLPVFQTATFQQRQAFPFIPRGMPTFHQSALLAWMGWTLWTRWTSVRSGGVLTSHQLPFTSHQMLPVLRVSAPLCEENCAPCCVGYCFLSSTRGLMSQAVSQRSAVRL